ncbi:MAG TPA: hypothetical protein VGA31_01430 [Thermoanaerobaculia bacterium]
MNGESARTDPPTAMRVGSWFAIVLAVALAAAFFLTAAGALPYKIAGYTVSREAWWRVSPVLLVVSALAAAIAFAIRTARPWSRHAVILLWTSIAIAALLSGLSGDIPRAVLRRALVEPAVLTLLCGWYFYGKPNVVEYFRRISKLSRDDGSI